MKISSGQSPKLLHDQFAQGFAFLIAVVGRPLSARRLMFSGIYARTQISEWMSSSILPKPLRKRDVDKNGLRKVRVKS